MKDSIRLIDNKGKIIYVFTANTFWQRFSGLMGTKSLPKQRGLMLFQCNSIHMFFMRYALDIIYVDANYEIVKIVEHLRPWHISVCLKAKHTIELPINTVQRYQWKVGMHFQIEE